MQPVIYADLRCLQDQNYRVRGIGHHLMALLRARERSAFANCKTIGLTDAQAPELPSEIALLADEITSSVNPCWNGTPGIFIDGTPMTHDTRFSLRFVNHPAFFRAAVLYDFIPLEWPGYLPTLGRRIDYLSKLARLRKFDWFFPISEYTAWRASELLGICRSQMHVTGAPVRRSLYQNRLEAKSSTNRMNDPYFLIVLYADPRKNPEVAIQAVRHLNLVYGRRIPLKVAGHYTGRYKRQLLDLAFHAEGEGFLEFCPAVSDQELVSLYTGAVATIVPSHLEGFSLPVVEASVCGCPVVVSTCAAHLELIDRQEALFPSSDAASLCGKLDALLNDEALGDFLVASQAHLGARFHEDAVGERFWSSLESAFENRREPAAVIRPKRPRLAFLSPFPPDPSDSSLYTAMAIRAANKLFDSDLYTDAPRPLTFDGPFRDAGGISLAPLLNGRYDAIVSVAARSSHRARVFDVLEKYGGPCILHDDSLTQIYFQTLGQERFLQLVTNRLGGSVSKQEVDIWLQHRDPFSQAVELVIKRANPLVVHSVAQRSLIKADYGVDAQLLPCCPTTFFDNEELTASAKRSARERYGIPFESFLISSFEPVSRASRVDICILALELLRDWNIPAELYLVGGIVPEQEAMQRLATWYGVAEHVHYNSGLARQAAYRDFLIASDAAVQLRTYAFGQLSIGLTNCIGAGLPSVATADMANSCDAPASVLTVPDRFSALQVAEQLALIWESRSRSKVHSEARAAYLEKHNFDNYAKRLVDILEIA